jgi:hypothetical protein
MSILKFKIAQALQRQQNTEEQEVNISRQPIQVSANVEPIQRNLRTRITQPILPKTLTPKGSTSCKNVMKNYSRVFTIFAISPLSRPHLMPLLQKHKLELSPFIDFVNSQKKAVNCIKGLRDSLLLVKDTDSEQISAMKQIFQAICVVFLKFFCVNWIYHSKIVDKTAHMSYRLKLLRKVRNPATFNYLEDVHQLN